MHGVKCFSYVQAMVLCAWCGRWPGGALPHMELHMGQAEYVIALLSGSWALIPFP